MERGVLAVEPVPVPVEESLAIAASIMAPQFSDNNLHFVHRPGDPTVVALADPERLRQILLNLMGNAVRYTPPGGSVMLEATTEDGMVFVRVLDTGVGIPADKLDVIFEPFTQLERRAGRGSGVGLGLALARDFARAMGGDLSVESEVGAGSVFTLSLQRCQAPD